MKGRKEEAEVIIRLDQSEGKAHVCVHAWPAMFRKMTKLHGVSLDGPDPENSARWVVPMDSILIRKGRKQLKQAPRMAFLAPRPPVQREFGESTGAQASLPV